MKDVSLIRVALLALNRLTVVTLFVSLALATSTSGAASDVSLSAAEIAQAMHDRAEPASKTQRVEIVVSDRRGRERKRTAWIMRLAMETERRSLVVYEAPSSVRGTGFLTIDYAADDREDDQWLFLPSTGRPRRVSAADRGSWFLGTDLTYEEVKKDSKFEVSDSEWSRLPDEIIDGVACYVLEATLRSERLKRELGHDVARLWIGGNSLVPLRVEYFAKSERLRTVTTQDVRTVGGFWSVGAILVDHHDRGTTSRLVFDELDIESSLEPDLFTSESLRRGAELLP